MPEPKPASTPPHQPLPPPPPPEEPPPPPLSELPELLPGGVAAELTDSPRLPIDSEKPPALLNPWSDWKYCAAAAATADAPRILVKRSAQVFSTSSATA